MKRCISLLWQLYYKIYKPKTKSEVIQQYARINNIKTRKIHLSKSEPNDIIGLPELIP